MLCTSYIRVHKYWLESKWWIEINMTSFNGRPLPWKNWQRDWQNFVCLFLSLEMIFFCVSQRDSLFIWEWLWPNLKPFVLIMIFYISYINMTIQTTNRTVRFGDGGWDKPTINYDNKNIRGETTDGKKKIDYGLRKYSHRSISSSTTAAPPPTTTTQTMAESIQ